MKTIPFVPWNKGLTKETDNRVKRCGIEGGKTRKGRTVWNKGLTKETDERVRKIIENRVQWNKGLTKETDERVRKIAESCTTWNGDLNTRRCCRCCKIKPLTEFSKDTHKLRGLCSQCKDCSKKYYLTHRKWYKDWGKAYYLSHKKWFDEWRKTYFRSHKEERKVWSKVSNANRKARLQSCEVNDIKTDQIRALLNKAFLCAICGRPFNDNGRKKTVDHIIPLSKRGNNTLSNVQIACLSCNLKKGNKVPAQEEK